MNYYVMNPNAQMIYRGTLESCRQWAKDQVKRFHEYGLKSPTYRIFYDSQREPTETISDS